jgi:hypothetical protein
MKYLISGHRLHKLKGIYSLEWIQLAIESVLTEIPISIGLSGMAGGVDLMFCQACQKNNIPYYAYVPFEEQGELYPDEKELRETCLKQAKTIFKAKNSKMVEDCDAGIIVFNGAKGGTHNVFEQLLEKRKPIIWLNPIAERIWRLE